MKKQKQSKKRWAWTEAQLRKDQSNSSGWYSVPSWICRIEHRENRTYVKKYLHKIKLGCDPDFEEIKIKNQSSSAGYNWW